MRHCILTELRIIELGQTSYPNSRAPRRFIVRGLHSAVTCAILKGMAKMKSFQSTIVREAKRQKMSGYRIARLAGMPMRTVQAYLAGDTDLAGRRIEMIAEVLGLELRPVVRGAKRKGAG